MAKKIPKTQMREGSIALKTIMQTELEKLAYNMVKQIISRAKRLTPSQRLKALKKIDWPGEQAYQQKITQALTDIAGDSIRQAQKELPKAKRMKLVETNFDDLPLDLQAKITKQSQLLVGTQLSDLEQNLFYQYTDSYDTTDDFDVLADDLNQAAIEYIDGQAIIAGANLLSAKVVNDSRNAFFFQKDTLDQVDAFVFTNGDPVTEICTDLAGTVFAKDDPNMFRYTPPLHWNCKSYIEPVPSGQLDNALDKADQDDVEPLKPSTAALEDQIQFSEAFFDRMMSIKHHH